jgi:hypothetical protein
MGGGRQEEASSSTMEHARAGQARGGLPWSVRGGASSPLAEGMAQEKAAGVGGRLGAPTTREA